MQSYIKIKLTQEQINSIEATRLNCGAIDPVSSFGDKPIQVEIEGRSGETAFFYYGVTDEVFILLPVNTYTIATTNPKTNAIKTNNLHRKYNPKDYKIAKAMSINTKCSQRRF